MTNNDDTGIPTVDDDSRINPDDPIVEPDTDDDPVPAEEDPDRSDECR
jgi:hypothetical protein